MKPVQLKDVMSSLRVVVTDCGYELHNAAGMAKYDGWGERREVNGIPEYFPCKLTLDGKEEVSPTPTRNSESDAQKILDDIDKQIKNSAAFSKLKPDGHIQAIIDNAIMTAPYGKIWLSPSFIPSGGINVAKVKNQPGDVNITLSIAGGSEAIKQAMQEASERGASEGAKKARQELLKDFLNRGPLRRILGI